MCSRTLFYPLSYPNEHFKTTQICYVKHWWVTKLPNCI